MPSALLTGATGFVGGHLLSRLVREGWQVTAIVRESSADLGSDVRSVRADLADLGPDALGGEAFDAVFHLGAYTPKTSGASDSDAIVAANIVGLRRLLAATTAVRRFVFTSTLDVYAPAADGERMDEGSALGPRSLYAASKLFGELLVQDAGVASGVDTVVLRYGHLYGPGEDAYDKFVPLVIRNLMQGRPPYVYGDGSAEVDLLYVEDAVEATLRAASRPEASGVINVVRGTSHSLRAIATELVDIVGFLGDIRYVPDRPQKPGIRFDPARMRERLGTWPLVDLAEGLRREVEHVAHAPSGA